MKKRLWMMPLLIIVLLCAGMLSGCNRTLIDTTFSYDRAIIKLANDEVVEVDIDSWRDYDGEQIQIIAEDGTIYLTNSFRCDLIKD